MDVIERFHDGNGKITAVTADVRGHRFLLVRHSSGEIRISPDSVVFDGSPWENPAWEVLKQLVTDGVVERVFQGLSIAPDDRYVWHGEPVPGLGG